MCQQINNNYYGNDHVILLLMSYTPTIKHWFLLIAYLMKHRGMTLDEAMTHTQERRAIVQPNEVTE